MRRAVKSEVITPLLAWEITVPLLTNRFMLFDFARWMLWTYGVMALVACLIGLFSRDLGVLWGVCQLFGVVCAAMTMLFLLIMLIVFRNRMELAFAVDKDGVNALVASSKAKVGNRLAILLGLLAGKPGVAGACPGRLQDTAGTGRELTRQLSPP